MKSRALFLSSKSRLRQTEQKYGITLNDAFLNQYIFILSEISHAQQTTLMQLAQQFADHLERIHLKVDSSVLLKVVNGDVTSIMEKIMDPALNDFFNNVGRIWAHNPFPGWKYKNKSLDFSNGPIIMGILNVTPDSFSDGGKYSDTQAAIDHALRMVEQGAKIIDVGGASTRPGADEVSSDEELKRVIPVIERLSEQTDAWISIDTYKSEVAKAALRAGADIVNDISACTFDSAMIDVVAQYHCPVILMHIKGTPKSMQLNPEYDDVVAEVYAFLENRVSFINDAATQQIMIDPGIGFGKRLQDNLCLLRDLKDFHFLNCPVLVGTSRKSFIGKILNNKVKDRLAGSISSHLYSAINGAQALRVHDVQETAEAIKVWQSIQNCQV